MTNNLIKTIYYAPPPLTTVLPLLPPLTALKIMIKQTMPAAKLTTSIMRPVTVFTKSLCVLLKNFLDLFKLMFTPY